MIAKVKKTKIGKKIVNSAKSKTMIIMFLVAMVGAIESQAHVITKDLPPETAGIVIALIGAVGMGLRAITTQPLENKGEDEE